MVDIMTVIPIYTLYNAECLDFTQLTTVKDVVYYILCGLKTTRILRALRLRKWFLFIEDAVKKFLSIMCLNIIVMILFSKKKWILKSISLL